MSAVAAAHSGAGAILVEQKFGFFDVMIARFGEYIFSLINSNFKAAKGAKMRVIPHHHVVRFIPAAS